MNNFMRSWLLLIVPIGHFSLTPPISAASLDDSIREQSTSNNNCRSKSHLEGIIKGHKGITDITHPQCVINTRLPIIGQSKPSISKPIRQAIRTKREDKPLYIVPNQFPFKSEQEYQEKTHCKDKKNV